jgi:hypothetical protein
MRAITFTDTDGSKWTAWVRGWLQHKIRNATQLRAHKQQAADERRAAGHEAHAQAIEKQTMMRWATDSGIFTKKQRA